MGVAFDTAWCALRDRARLQPGETVLVLGASGAVGIAAVQLAKAMGARVLAGDRAQEKAAMVRRAGADAVIDLSAADLRDSLRAQVYRLTDGRGADVVLDPLGGDAFDAALRARCLARAARRHRLRQRTHPASQGELPAAQEHRDQRTADQRLSQAPSRHDGGLLRGTVRLVRAGRLVPLEVETYPLERAVEAMAAVRDRRARGRVVLAIRES